jgi:hypothetical protein
MNFPLGDQVSIVGNTSPQLLSYWQSDRSCLCASVSENVFSALVSNNLASYIIIFISVTIWHICYIIKLFKCAYYHIYYFNVVFVVMQLVLTVDFKLLEILSWGRLANRVRGWLASSNTYPNSKSVLIYYVLPLPLRESNAVDNNNVPPSLDQDQSNS